MIYCLLDDDTSDDEDIGVYVRKVSPNQIEYAVGRADDFQKTFRGKIYRQTLRPSSGRKMAALAE